MISAFDLFKIGIGPSSSHTVGPMKAAAAFVAELAELGVPARIEAVLYGSLAWTGRGHGTDRAVVLGLCGEQPDTVDLDHAETLWARVREGGGLPLAGGAVVPFRMDDDLILDCATQPPLHPNTMALKAFDAQGRTLLHQRWCSIGGGFIVREGAEEIPRTVTGNLPFPYRNAAELLSFGAESGRTIAQMALANEEALRPPGEVVQGLDRIGAAMLACIDRGLATTGELPGGLKVRRRAAALYARVRDETRANDRPLHETMDLLSVFAMAVNEENAAGGRVVTAPTNGAAGVIPAVLRYYRDRCPGATEEGARIFLLTAAAIGALFKMNASISGAEVGCQGEVGVASSMAAAGLAAALGGTNAQIENAAEIAMEHHLGMTCDPVGGLVQIPCIERNAFGAVKAVTAASLALKEDGSHKISLDQVVATMRQTGADMHHKYKETSQGGLAVNWVEC
ncbi:L-serine ammonia-lyase [Alsobacter sp. SYSU M60028]|uniref:L-serine dehydratase n=1 Tax=Alsobacter ponti TaxID=2962936 RepID=A0ABT1L803_9HYPH|nr:L-serine ammonia-lyase [Alsobacter ponti]MCP8937138.1 L-serine ammonia-lyase [Alsobacter ponti]